MLFEPIINVTWHRALAEEYDAQYDISGLMDLDRSLPPTIREVSESYEALSRETLFQYVGLGAQHGIKVKHTHVDPYLSSDALFKDLDAGVLRVFQGGELPDNHPMLKRVFVSLTLNDIFRAVHDFYGHYGSKDSEHYPFATVARGKDTNGIGITGEELAYQRHKQMYTKAAWLALTVETRCQTAANNLLPRVVDTGGFIEQKAIWLPEWCYLT